MKLLTALCLSVALTGTQAMLAAPAHAAQTQQTMEEAQYSDAELDSVLAPIALYPDSLLTHILIASTYPLQVIEADRWRQANKDLDADDVADEIDEFDWEPSVKALVPFTDLLNAMSEDIAWLEALGDNVIIDESRVLARIQVLRQHAEQSGSLQTDQHHQIERDDENPDVIIIRSAQPEVVYVPYYDPVVVYGAWWHPVVPVSWHHHHHVHSGISLHWSPGFHVAMGFYFGDIFWHRRHIVVTHNRVVHHYPRHKVIKSREYTHWKHDYRYRRSGYSKRVVHTRPAHQQQLHTARVDRAKYHKQTKQHYRDAKPHKQVAYSNKMVKVSKHDGKSSFKTVKLHDKPQKQAKQTGHRFGGDKQKSYKQPKTITARVQKYSEKSAYKGGQKHQKTFKQQRNGEHKKHSQDRR